MFCDTFNGTLFRARDVKGLVLFCLLSFGGKKNRSAAEPGAARPGAQKKIDHFCIFRLA